MPGVFLLIIILKTKKNQLIVYDFEEAYSTQG